MANFTYVQSALGSSSAGTGITSVTLLGVGAKNLLVVDTVAATKAGKTIRRLFTVADTQGVNYALTDSNIVTTGTFHIAQGLAFVVHPGGTADVTATWQPVSGVDSDFNFSNINVFEFSYNGFLSFDKDAVASFPSASGHSPITTPSITPTNVGSLLFGAWFANSGTETGANSPWVQPGSATAEAYIASSSAGATAANFTENADPDTQSSLIAAFFASPYIMSGQWGLG